MNSFLKSLDESDRKRDNINTFAVSFCMNLLSLGVIQTLEDQEIQSDKFEVNFSPRNSQKYFTVPLEFPS